MSIDELCIKSGYIEGRGTNLLGLYQAALYYNLPAVPVKITYDQLCEQKCPCILWIHENHFVVCYGSDKDNVILKDPPSLKYTIAKSDLLESWDGVALIFSTSESQKFREQNDIQQNNSLSFLLIPITEYNLGEVIEGDIVSHPFQLINRGDQSVHVFFRPSCSCVTTQTRSKIIPPGGIEIVNVSFNTSGYLGKKEQYLHVYTNRYTDGISLLKLSVNIQPSVKAIPANLLLENINIGQEIERVVQIFSYNKELEINNIKLPENISVDVGKLDLLQNDGVIIPIKLILKKRFSGRYKDEVIVYTNDKYFPEIAIPIDWTIADTQ